MNKPSHKRTRFVGRLFTLVGVLLILLIVGLPTWFASTHLYWGEALTPGAYDYPANAASGCPSGPRDGNAGVFRDQRTEQGFRYTVKTPTNYDPNQAHPLVVVYAPSGLSASLSERMVGLTREATRAGFIIAWAGSGRMSISAVQEFSTIPKQISEKWCIDMRRVYLTGHSDGGTIASAIAFMEETRHIPAAIAPSAAGIRSGDLKAYSCPDPLSVMVMHNEKDRLFPSFGESAARWWANCSGCQQEPIPSDVDGCVVFPDCRNDVQTWFCQSPGGHMKWPDRNREIIRFFSAAERDLSSSN
ncbi:MAG: poly(3-hydroxybutyrate) depolymerase [Pseudomonadota bacterium]|nr:poly(3-hydroxybutyrate) depolymerase [Pseudomonadota bacterium]